MTIFTNIRILTLTRSGKTRNSFIQNFIIFVKIFKFSVLTVCLSTITLKNTNTNIQRNTTMSTGRELCGYNFDIFFVSF